MSRELLLGVTGSIAAYKAVVLARCLQRAGHAVQPLATRSALEFVGAATWLGISHRPLLVDLFDGRPGERHVDLWERADAMIVAPATADAIARLAQGQASDLVCATALCRRGPLWVAPAMHPAMWANPAVARNVDRLRQDGVEILGPVEGEVASGDIGLGRMLEPEAIAREVIARLRRTQDLAGIRVAVSAGPTHEDLDPVRFLGNRSSGKMGFALARAARDRGATVELVTGPVALSPPAGCTVVPIRSALELQQAMAVAAARADLVVMAAAVADVRPRDATPHKRPKRELPSALELVPNPDIIAELARARQGALPVLVAFSLGTGSDDEVVALGRRKLVDKAVDLVVANAAADAFGGETNRATLVTRDDERALGTLPKLELAHAILDRALALHQGATRAPDLTLANPALEGTTTKEPTNGR